MTRRSRSTTLAIGVMTLVGLSAPAAAQTRSVHVAIAGASGDADSLEALVREFMARVPVAVDYTRPSVIDATDVITPREGAAPAVARVWLDLGRGGRATVFLVDEPWERILIRHVDAPDGFDEVTRETVGHIVRSSVEAMLAGQRIGLAREEARAALGLTAATAAAPSGEPRDAPPATTPRDTDAPTPGARASRSPAPVLDLGIRYEGAAWSSDAPLVHGPAATVGTSALGGSPGFGLELSGQYRFPVTIDERPAGVRLDSGALRLVGILDLAVTERLTARVAAGGGVDLVGVEARIIAGTDTTAEPAELTTVPIARLALGAGHLSKTGHGLWGALAAEMDLVNTRYVVDVEGAKATVFDPWRLRAGAYLGVTTRVLGP